MKRESLGWFVAGAVIVLTCTLGAMQQQGGQVGRYQLLEGTYSAFDDEPGGKKGVATITTVWRIDTVTGETVQYMATVRRTGWSLPILDFSNPEAGIPSPPR